MRQISLPIRWRRPRWSFLAEAASDAGLGPVAGSVEELAGARGELLELLVWALAEQVLGIGDLQAIAEHYRDGAQPDIPAARAAGMSPAAFRQRRSRTVGRLRAAAPRWAQAA